MRNILKLLRIELIILIYNLNIIIMSTTFWVSDSQRYKMLWNGWTVDVIAHIFGYLPK